MDITSAAIATLISAVTSALVTFFINNSNKKKDLENQLDELLKIGIEYPYLESQNFTDSWTSKHDITDEKFLRYELYATMVFNYLSRLSSHYKYDTKKIEKELAVKDWIRIHKKYWYDPTAPNENIDTYDAPFVEMVNKYLIGGNVK
ncbi:MAG: hypothetical protein FWD26_03820 [Treponema sp.]|nr:hypothetical protein [Treponema sp.]